LSWAFLLVTLKKRLKSLLMQNRERFFKERPGRQSFHSFGNRQVIPGTTGLRNKRNDCAHWSEAISSSTTERVKKARIAKREPFPGKKRGGKGGEAMPNHLNHTVRDELGPEMLHTAPVGWQGRGQVIRGKLKTARPHFTQKGGGGEPGRGRRVLGVLTW